MKSEKSRIVSFVFVGTPATFNDPMPASTGASLYSLRAVQSQAPVELDGDSYNADRGQWDANKILLRLAAMKGNGVGGAGAGVDFVLGLTDADIFVPSANFVFGLADPSKGAAVVSVHRLRESASGKKLSERVFKEVAHELGHLMGLGHCDNPTCIMSFAKSVEEVDARLPYLCPTCARKVQSAASI